MASSVSWKSTVASDAKDHFQPTLDAGPEKHEARHLLLIRLNYQFGKIRHMICAVQAMVLVSPSLD